MGDRTLKTAGRGGWDRGVRPHAGWRARRRRMGDRTLKIVGVVLVLAAGFVARVTYEQVINPSTPALAQEDQYDCASFGSQESAQSELNRDPRDPNNLDPDSDGQACEDYDYGGTSSTNSASPS